MTVSHNNVCLASSANACPALHTELSLMILLAQLPMCMTSASSKGIALCAWSGGPAAALLVDSANPDRFMLEEERRRILHASARQERARGCSGSSACAALDHRVHKSLPDSDMSLSKHGGAAAREEHGGERQHQHMTSLWQVRPGLLVR